MNLICLSVCGGKFNACAIGAVDGKVQEVISLFEGKR
jgi:hypothetical protein